MNNISKINNSNVYRNRTKSRARYRNEGENSDSINNGNITSEIDILEDICSGSGV